MVGCSQGLVADNSAGDKTDVGACALQRSASLLQSPRHFKLWRRRGRADQQVVLYRLRLRKFGPGQNLAQVVKAFDRPCVQAH